MLKILKHNQRAALCAIRPLRPSNIALSSCHNSLERCKLSDAALQGYLVPKTHGTYRRYVLELLVVLGLLLTWIGPLFGLVVMTPIVLLTVQNGKIITTERDCFGGGLGPTECPAESYFDYYFWNITNPTEVRQPIACTDVIEQCNKGVSTKRNPL